MRNNRRYNWTSQDSWLLTSKTKWHTLHLFILDRFYLFWVTFILPKGLIFLVDESWERWSIDVRIKNPYFRSLSLKSSSNVNCNCTLSYSSFTTWDCYDFFNPQKITFSGEFFLFLFGSQRNIYIFESTFLQFSLKKCFDTSIIFVEV